MSFSRFLWLAGSLAAILLLMAVLVLSPVELQITLTPKAREAQAGLPTTTPLPPTTIPATPPPATPIPPTAVPPSVPATPVPPTVQPRRPTATPDVPTTTPLPAAPHIPQLAILKSVEPAQVKVGERATFTLRVTNLGDGPATDVVIADEVPDQLEVVDLRSTKGEIVVDSQRVTAYPRTMAPGEVQTVAIVVRVRAGTTDREIANLAVVTLGQPDDPGDNTSITTLRIDPPDRSMQTIPPHLPTTADPTVLSVWAQYWPLLVLGFALFAFGIATRRGTFRAQSMQVTIGGIPSISTVTEAERDEWAGHATQVLLDPDDLLQRWQAGISTADLVMSIAQRNPHADRLAVSIAVQRVLQRKLMR